LSLDTLASRHQAVTRSVDPEIRRLLQEVESARAERARLAMRVASGGAGAPGRDFAAAKTRLEEAERALAAKSATFGALLERAHVGADAVRRALPAGTALVSYATHSNWPQGGEGFYVALVARAGSPAPVVVPLGIRGEIDRLIGEWTRLAARPPADGSEPVSRAAGGSLRRAIWDPVAKHLDGATRVLLVPEGQLHRVNFAALPQGQDRYLVDGPWVLHYLAAERDLVPAPRSPGHGLLAVGGPSFDRTATPAAAADSQAVYRGPRSSCESFAKMRFTPLPEAEREASTIGSLWSATDETVNLLVGAAASETAFKRRAPGHRVLHVATHGFTASSWAARAARPSIR
jgi:CHAT domain-containing protein